jgi:drug/metabolite transporter (DMT)-like permease
MSWLALAAYVCLVGGATILVKLASAGADNFYVAYYTAIGSMVITAPALLLVHRTVVPSTPGLWQGVLAGVLYSAGGMFWVYSLRSGVPLSIAAPVSNVYVIPVIVLSIIFLSDAMTWTRFFGIMLTLVGAAILMGS